ncbi:MAG TPA: hypothetical protein ACHBX0_02345 [Arsenophonus sp.]
MLALQLIHSLDRPIINLVHVTFALLDILGKTPFVKNQEINCFVNKLMDNYLKNYSSHLLNDLEAHPTIIKTLLNYFDQQPHMMISGEWHSGFIQTLLAAITKATNAVKIAVHHLYKKYLDFPNIQQ